MNCTKKYEIYNYVAQFRIKIDPHYELNWISRLFQIFLAFSECPNFKREDDLLCSLFILQFIYSEKATKFCEISTLLLSVCTVDKSKVEISQNFVAFSEYTNFKKWTITNTHYFEWMLHPSYSNPILTMLCSASENNSFIFSSKYILLLY